MNRMEKGLLELNQKLAQSLPAVAPDMVRSYECTECNDRGFVEYLKIQGETEPRQLSPDVWGMMVQYDYPGSRVLRSDCDCVQRKATASRLRKLLDSGSVPERFHSYSFASWAKLPSDARAGKERMLEACTKYAAFAYDPSKGVKGGLVLSGSPGLGKTGLASCAVMERAKRGQHVLWIDWKELLDKCLAAVRNPDVDMAKIIDAAGEIEFLFIDDLGDMKRGGDVTDFTRDTLYSIISRRYNRNRELLVTTNLNYDQFEGQFGERIASRVFEMCIWVNVTGENLRK